MKLNYKKKKNRKKKKKATLFRNKSKKSGFRKGQVKMYLKKKKKLIKIQVILNDQKSITNVNKNYV